MSASKYLNPIKSASLIILKEKAVLSANKYNYEILCMKRKNKRSFQNVHAFPGGILEKSDKI